jgi:hypothetical protein
MAGVGVGRIKIKTKREKKGEGEKNTLGFLQHCQFNFLEISLPTVSSRSYKTS